jgi:hypothetical protein
LGLRIGGLGIGNGDWVLGALPSDSVFIIIRRSGLGADFYIKPDLTFLIYGSWAWGVGFGTLKTDFAFLWYWDLVYGWDLGVVLTCPVRFII